MGRKIFLIFILTGLAILIGINIYLKISVQKSKGTQLVAPQRTPQLNKETKSIIIPVEASGPVQKDSPDGKLTLLMNSLKDKNGITYTFSVSGKEIFVKTVDLLTTITIPYNTWDPNGKYIFLKEESPSGVRFFVLSTTVLSSDQNEHTADITDLFSKKYPDLKIKDVTGWGGINLIIVNSMKTDGERGPSFWFEMPSHYFSQLSTRF